MSSWEFTEWIAFWQYEAELSQPPDPDAKPSLPELTKKIYAFKDRQNARWAAQQGREQVIADGTVGMPRDDAIRPRRGV